MNGGNATLTEPELVGKVVGLDRQNQIHWKIKILVRLSHRMTHNKVTFERSYWWLSDMGALVQSVWLVQDDA
jgi:hypothetical protein